MAPPHRYTSSLFILNGVRATAILGWGLELRVGWICYRSKTAAGQSKNGYFAGAGTKITFGIIMCTPLLPSTSSVMLRSAATLDSM